MAGDQQGKAWVGSWTASMHIASPGLDELPSQIVELGGRTLRQIVRLSLGGAQVRIRLSNIFGDAPVTIGAARVALRGAGAHIDPASDRQVTFSGLSAITIPAGGVVVSDPVQLAVPHLADLAISLSFPEPATSRTVHGLAFQTNYLSSQGDFTASTALPVERELQHWLYLTGVDVAVTQPTGAIVCLGDSLTDGAFSTPDTNHRWPNVLAERLADSGQPMRGVLNQGIGGNMVLTDAPPDSFYFGSSAQSRFSRDVLAIPGVRHLILFAGINDIGMSATSEDLTHRITAGDLIDGLRRLAEQAHAHGILVYGVTLTPWEGTENFYTAAGEDIRQEVNAWIRGSEAYDAVLDFDAVVRDPAHPTRLLPAYNVGDRLHLNDAGFQALAGSIDLALFA